MTTSDAASKCSHCGQPPHPGVCPTIKAIVYFENGAVKRVEYKTAADFAIPPSPYFSALPPPYVPTLNPPITWGADRTHRAT